MTHVSYSWDPDMNFADPKTCTYYAYRCTYCEALFYLVDPKTFQVEQQERISGEIQKQMRLKRGRIDPMVFVCHAAKR